MIYHLEGKEMKCLKDKQKKLIWEIIPTLGGGGAEKMVLDLADGLNNTNYQTRVISLYSKDYATSNRVEYAKERQIDVSFLNKHAGFDLALLFKILKMIIKEKPDIVHTHIESFQYIAVAKWFHKFNHVHTMHSIVGRESRIYQFLLRTASRKKMTYFVALSKAIEKSMRQKYGTSEQRLACIPNGIDRTQYPPVKRPFYEESLTFIAVGSLIPVKNHKMMINAFSELLKTRKKDDSLIILGEGSLRDELHAQIIGLGLENRVLLHGNVDNVSCYLNNADVFLMTSHYEGVSLALLEAASTGLPIITTNTGGTLDVVKNDAIIIDDNDEESLYKEMLKISDDIQYRKQYSELALAVASRFDKEKMVNQYADLYMRIIEERD